MSREIVMRKVDHAAGRLDLKPRPWTPKGGWTCLKTLESLGLGGGLITVFLGMVLSAAGWAEGSREGGHILVVCGTVLLLAAAPLLLLGAHCLDVEETRKRRARAGAFGGECGSHPPPLARSDARGRSCGSPPP
ncbi:MAG: hypothetical protein ACJ74T_07980 [Pyrinomonadaceae bacterium]